MKIETTQVTKLTIHDVPSMDPIAVYLEDLGPGRGKATITSSNDSWSYGWNAMGEGYDIRKFLSKCDTPYLAQKFGPDVPRTETDYDKVVEAAKKKIFETRRSDMCTKETARRLYNETDYLLHMDVTSSDYAEAMAEIFGDEWWDCLPTVPHYQYLSLCKIIDVVKEALRNKENGEAKND